MQTKWLIPAEGIRVRFEDGGPMPPEGAEVPLSQYYRRRLRDGDLVDPEPELDPALVDAARACIARGDTTSGGAPTTTALAAEYGAPVTAELRDQAFAAIQASEQES